MTNPQDELEALRAQVASLTARVHRLEHSSGIEPQISGTQATPTPPSPPITKSPEQPPITVSREDAERRAMPTPPPPPMLQIPPRPNVAAPKFAQAPTFFRKSGRHHRQVVAQ